MLSSLSTVLIHQKNKRECKAFWTDLPLKNRISPLNVLIASKDKAGSHSGGVPASGGSDSVGTAGSLGETGGDPKEDRGEDANISRK